jgi:serine/threonine protein kinase
MLVELNTQPHEHILTHIAAWSQGEECYILFPLARMNLRRFLKERQPEADSNISLWLLRQMKGLADAVTLIHNLDQQITATHLQVPVATGKRERKQGYHHDLKPENMLLFYIGSDYTEGSLKISDFGMGKVNRVPQGSQIVSKRTRTLSGTLTYESPDFEMHRETGRPHDMWALGCVFLELLCWLFIAPQSGGKSFQTDRMAPLSSKDSSILSDSFYFMTTKDGEKVPKLKPMVVKWIDAIKGNPCCKDEFLCILELICKAGGLLEPEMHTRMRAETLNQKLGKILHSATNRLEAAPNHYTGNTSQARKVTEDSLGEEPASPTYTPMISRQVTNSPPAEPTIASLPEIVFQEVENGELVDTPG